MSGAAFNSDDFLFTGNNLNKLLHLLLFPRRQFAHLAQRLHQFALLPGGEHDTTFHYLYFYCCASGKTSSFQPLSFHGDGGHPAVIRIAACIANS